MVLALIRIVYLAIYLAFYPRCLTYCFCPLSLECVVVGMPREEPACQIRHILSAIHSQRHYVWNKK